MRTAFKLGAALMTVLYFVACSPVNFEQQKVSSDCADGSVCIQKCQGDDCYKEVMVSKSVGRGKVDFLIINDNSGSMSADQRKMATKFPMFLDALKQLDYRIAMTTTDISGPISQAYSGTKPPSANAPSAANQNGALQDGKLIVFGNGQKYLEGSDGSVSGANTNYFNTAVQRQETLNCEQSNYADAYCPSNDERGVFAANLALDRNEFVRSGAHLAIIVLSNEDERGMSDTRSAGKPNANTYNDDISLINLYKRENYDLPTTLVNRFKSKFVGKSLSVHPIIIKPNDANCLASESDPSKFIRAKEGYTYQELKDLVGGKSTMGSICDSDYTTTLQAIGNSLQTIDPLPFTCRPANDDYNMSYTDANGTAFTAAQAAAVSVTANFSAMTLTVNTALPAGTTATLKYKCTK